MVLRAVVLFLKLIEYAQRVHGSIDVSTNDFFMFDFVLTGVHFLHVLVGLAVIGYFWRRYASLAGAGASARGRELSTGHLVSASVFWHPIDLLWVVLFPLLYLVG